jgi:hypothetical protein
MIYPSPLDKVLAGQTVKKFTNNRLILIVLSCADRLQTRNEIETLLRTLRIPYKRAREAGSSFEALTLTANNKPARITFKPAVIALDSRLTALMESAQCMYLAAQQVARRSIDTAYLKANLNRVKAFYEIDVKEKDIFERLTKDWIKSHEMIANHLGPKLKGNDYVFHRNSSIVQQIYAMYSKLNREQKVFSAPDKWNPADIWAIRRGYNLNGMSSVASWDEFNNWLREAIDSRDLVPISLKKVAKVPKISTVNTNEDRNKPKEEHVSTKFTSLRANTGKKDWTTSKNVQICFSKGQSEFYVELRQSAPGKKLNGELNKRRDVARHGKILIEKIISIAEKLGQKVTLPDRAETAKKSAAYDSELINKVTDLANKLENDHVPAEQLTQMLQQKQDPDWLQSKYEGLLILEAFSKMNDQKKEQAVEGLYSAASAANDLAGPFLKVAQL